MNDTPSPLRLAVTLGDPTGIGPELVRATLDRAGVDLLRRTLEAQGLMAGPLELTLFGDRGVLDRAPAVGPLDARLHLVEVTQLDDEASQPGRPTVDSGRAQVAYLEAALAAARRGEFEALVTAPIHKSSCQAAGFAFPGHTELLAERLAPEGGPPLPVTMMFAGPKLTVSLATIHHALSAVPRLLTVEGLVTTLLQTAEALERDLGVEAPRIGVAGLNPHAGEGGLFGDEEERIVRPALDLARQRAARARFFGPVVPDALFRAHLEGRYDGVVALYHDQGLIPVKLIDFDEAVNVTLGLPLVRTSPDHGVAHDLARRAPAAGAARPTSFQAALVRAVQLAARRRASSR
jgi:4-hydroxythreonine-4-phosphate dehydrogenase